MLNAKRRRIIRENAEKVTLANSPQKGWLANNWYIILSLIFLVVLVYANGLSGAFVSDDINWIPNNPNVGNFGSLFQGQARPATWFIFYFAHAIGGLSPFFYRLPNLLFHTGNVIAIFILLSLLINQKTAIFTSLIFAVHPILVESVTWIAGGSYAAYTFFFLLSFICYILAKNKPKFYVLTILFILLSLAFSEKAVVLFLIFPLYEIAFGSLKKMWKFFLPFLIAGIVVIVTLFSKIQGIVTALKNYNYVQPGLDNPLLKIPISITEYLRLIFWPADLSLYHHELVFSLSQYLVRLGILLILFFVIFLSYRKKRFVFFWLSFFIITLLPTLTPYRIASTVAERYVYMGSLGIFVLIGMTFDRLSNNGKLKQSVYIVFTCLILALSVRTFVRNRDWHSEDSLWIASAKVSPNSPNVLLNLGDMYGRHKDYQKAIEVLNRAIELKPDYADAYHNLANTQTALYADGNNGEYLNKAISNYLLAIKNNPSLWQSHQNLGIIYFNTQQYGKAVEELKKAIEINPSNLNLQYNLGIIYLNSQQIDKAKEVFLTILQIDPNNQSVLEILNQIK